MPNIKFSNISVTYYNKKNKENIVALKNVNNVFDNEKTHVIAGFSGSGKTTLLKTLFDGVDYEGDIFFDDIPILNYSVSERNMGYVSQNYALYPHMTVFENIAFPLRNIGVPREEIIKRVSSIAEELGISHCLSRKPKQISGGQQQRVVLARALVKNPEICLFDEPLSNLDSNNAEIALQLIKKSILDRHMTSLYVTHDIKEATFLADIIYFIDNGEIIFKGTPEEFLNCEDERILQVMEENA